MESKSEVDTTGEKSNKFFMNLEKYRASQNTIRKVIHHAQEITDHLKTNNHIFSFYQKFFEERPQNDTKKISEFLKDIPIPLLTEEQKKICEDELTEKEIHQSLTSMENNKSPGNDGLTKEFYCTFWDKIKNIFINSLRESKCLKALSTSQRQAIIRLIEKPNKGKRFTSNWRPISLLNVDQKLIPKTLASRLKKVLPFLIGSGQSAYVNGRFLGESGRLIADIIETCNLKQLEGYLVAIDFEKAFDSLNHSFLTAALENYDFGNDFIKWIKILLKNRESCMINGGHTTKYLTRKRS